MRLRLRKKTKDPLWGDKEVNDDEKNAPHLVGGQALSGPFDAKEGFLRLRLRKKTKDPLWGDKEVNDEKSAPHLVGGQARSSGAQHAFSCPWCSEQYTGWDHYIPHVSAHFKKPKK